MHGTSVSFGCVTRESREIEVMPFSFDMTAFIAANGKSIRGSDTYFYGVDSIVEREI